MKQLFLKLLGNETSSATTSEEEIKIHYEIDFSEENKIGEGQFSKVYKIRRK